MQVLKPFNITTLSRVVGREIEAMSGPPPLLDYVLSEDTISTIVQMIMMLVHQSFEKLC